MLTQIVEVNMGCIVRSTVIVRGEPIDRHFVVLDEPNESRATDAIRKTEGGGVTIVGWCFPNGAKHYFPARVPLS